MEEPELSLPPHVQKRVVDKVRDLAAQSLFTSHSPYVIEQFSPEQMTVMRRDATGLLNAARIVLPNNLRLKVFREGFRTRFCEALLARRVLVVEGKTELVAYSAAARRAAVFEPQTYDRLDTLGWVPFDAGSQTAVADFARFFGGLGKMTATVFDQQAPAARAVIAAACDRAFEQPHAGFEALLSAEVPGNMQAWFVDWFNAQGEWPPALAHVLPPASSPQAAFAALFLHKKGADSITAFFEQCTDVGHLPSTMRTILSALKVMAAPPAPPPPPAAPTPPDLFS
jgi:putative ATP-dependent endonuclease of OLD family